MFVLIGFSAVITEKVDSLHIIAKSSGGGGGGGTDVFRCNKELSLSIQNMRGSIPNRSGTILQHGLKTLKLILPIAASNHLSECYEKYRGFRALSTEKCVAESSIWSGASIKERLNNIFREDNIWFKMSDNGHYCIVFTMHAFCDYIFDWVGKEHDCYILAFASLSILSQKFENSEPISVIFKGDEEEDLSPVVHKTENVNVLKSTLVSDTNNKSLTTSL